MTSLPERPSLAAWWRDLLELRDPLRPAIAYFLYLALAELLTVLVQVQVGLLLHLLGLSLLLLHAARIWERRGHRLLLALALVPLIRVVSLSLPLVGFPLVYWYLITGLPLFAAAFVTMRLLEMGWRDLGLHARGSLKNWAAQILVGLGGLLLGYVEYLILRPAPLAPALTWADLWLPALVLLVSTGYLEELIFRRLIQRTAVEQIGRRRGILYAALLFAVLHAGYLSVTDVLFVFAVGLAFGFLVHWTGSLVGVSLAHGLTNVALFLVIPFWAAGDLPLPEMPRPGLPAFDFFQEKDAEPRHILPTVRPPPNAEYLGKPWAPWSAAGQPHEVGPLGASIPVEAKGGPGEKRGVPRRTKKERRPAQKIAWEDGALFLQEDVAYIAYSVTSTPGPL